VKNILSRFSKQEDFDIRLWFVVISLVTIVAVNTISAFFLSKYVSEHLVDREGEVAQEFLNSIVSAEGSGLKLFEGPAPSPALQSFANHVNNLPGVVRANIYSPDFFIRYSTNTNLVGLKFSDNEELKDAFKGELISNLEVVDAAAAKSEHIALDVPGGEEFIEAYMPVTGGADHVVAVVEFYRKPNALKVIISSISMIIWASAAIGGLLLFVSLYGAIARGSRIIESQKREIGGMAALAALGQMASAVAHSMRNPLAGIQSSTELLRIQHPGVADEATRDILGEVDRMNQHVHELLEYSRSERSNGQRVNLTHFLRRCLSKAEPGLTRRSIAVKLEVDPASGCEVSVDPMLFNQVINSILTNASEAMPQGGDVRVCVEKSPDGKQVMLDIIDTGKGIPKDVLQRLPEPFVTTKARGLGLGLALSKRIVERFGGRLELESQEGHGTTVRIVLTAL
jgi:two-component system, NtrC family, sensor histidine kinase HydH